ncbi:MAG: nucleotidyltransferase domain-containing protein [Deltaproteobacteria bacterium]|jgi:hypothetical protein|nr:nucleotidyltransferase domain-containing protein [Deltaproteobacteria bacterium]
MYKKILKALNTIEKEYQVCILYACASGNRAWGFTSQNSDFYVRFIYIQQPSFPKKPGRNWIWFQETLFSIIYFIMCLRIVEINNIYYIQTLL